MKLVALGALTLLLPVAGFAHGAPVAVGQQNKADQSMLTIDLRAVGSGTFYVGNPNVLGLWEESGSYSGLQVARTDVGGGHVVEPDIPLVA
ncbi:MAG: hypothetical protein ACYDCK_15060 [Thermoplasmatota archaeon]